MEKEFVVCKIKIFILIGLWKIGWILIFVVLLVLELNFNMNFFDLNLVVGNYMKNNSIDFLLLVEKKIDVFIIGIIISLLVSGIDDFL